MTGPALRDRDLAAQQRGRVVRAMVAALFTLTARMERARRQRKIAGTLSLLQLVADRQPIRRRRSPRCRTFTRRSSPGMSGNWKTPVTSRSPPTRLTGARDW
jgi:hypothetical protein